jgi:hypothetical protein
MHQPRGRSLLAERTGHPVAAADQRPTGRKVLACSCLACSTGPAQVTVLWLAAACYFI